MKYEKKAATFWVSTYFYEKATQKWPSKDVRVNTYLPKVPNYLEVTKPGYSTGKRGLYKKIRVKS